MKKQTVPISGRALIQRINRKLKLEDQVLRAARGERARMDLGEYYIIDVRHNFVLFKDIGLKELGRELGVLAKYERLEEEV